MTHREHKPTNTSPTETALSAHERPQELVEKPKRNPEHYHTHEAHEATETARRGAAKERRAHQAERHNTAQRLISHHDREASFDQTMDEVRKHFRRSTRRFSRFIHDPTTERVSDIVGKTIARPNAILAGSLCAFLGVLGLYFYAKYAGFALQGSETIITFILGWFAGMLFDLCKVLFSGRR